MKHDYSELARLALLYGSPTWMRDALCIISAGDDPAPLLKKIKAAFAARSGRKTK